MKIKIKKASANDIEALIYIENKCFPEFQRNSKANIKRAVKSKTQNVYFAESSQKPNDKTGSITLWHFNKSIRIYSIAVLPEYQNKGIGDAMLKFVLNHAKKVQTERIVLEADANNSPLIAWYKKRGFEIVKTKKDFYDKGKDAVRMELKLFESVFTHKSTNIIVINHPYKWTQNDINAKIISVKEYIKNPVYQNSTSFRIFNLCSSYKYQSYGYYISLLASARGQRVIPNITTIRDFRISNVIKSASYDIQEHIDNSLKKVNSDTFSLKIYFGKTPQKGFNTLAGKIHKLFDAPLFKVDFTNKGTWLIKDIRVLPFSKIPEEEIELLYIYAKQYFDKKKFRRSKLTNFKYDLAILVNPNETNPPSCNNALQKFKQAANKKGMYLEFITKTDIDKINEFDALFIRETTNVNDHTYEISRLAYSEGLVVIDDPWSILRCSNKIFQNETFRKHKVLTPETTVLTKNFFRTSDLDSMQFPLVLKQPDSAFSLGVTKAETKQQAIEAIKHLFKTSDMLICQKYLYSEFDWRIGVIDNKPLFACKYFMSKGHWQIYNWMSTEGEIEGQSETLPIEEVPENVIKTAIKASSLMGDGLYGVDMKVVDGKVYVVEVNDNPNIDFGIEDFVSQELLYNTIIDSIIRRIKIAKDISMINFSS
ncbi:MAG TPA: GNAT family N-acetyltransferase [Bacteroidales bacterium]|nr:GNAT family N-acetyltransferase [Bacteroidales bacterium]